MSIFEICNLSIVLLFAYGAYRRQAIPLYVFVTLMVTSLIPFFLNDFMFPASYMPDQSMYLELVQQIRSFDFAALEPDSNFNIQVKTAALLFAFAPIPFMETVQSLAICNHLVYVALITWLYSQKNLRGWPFLFVLFYPSLIFYSSLALRDTFVVTFMVLATIFFIDKKWSYTGFAMIFLSLLKPQNAILMSAFFLMCSMSSHMRLGVKNKVIVSTICASIGLFYASVIDKEKLNSVASQIVSELNYHREFMFLSNGGDPKDFIPLSTIGDSIVRGLISSADFLMKPLPWQSENIFQFVQSIENLSVALVIVFLLSSVCITDKKLALKWSLLLLGSMSLYSIIVFNYGAAARYRFPFVMVFAVGLSYEYQQRTRLYLDRLLPIKT